jgi:Zn-dependent protease
LHWTWFVLAFIAYQYRQDRYPSLTWFLLEYASLFAIVLMHEFGHSLACRQVGGQADQIVLWPLGGVAYVAPPPRPGATLWSIAAGPLVNVLLLPVLLALKFLAQHLGWEDAYPNLFTYLKFIGVINLALLIFNMLPFYPLDGGQILRSLLWFVMGRARSLQVATGLGFVGALGLILLALWGQSIWIGILAAFMVMNCWQGWRHAQGLLKMSRLPKHEHVRCPACHEHPPREPLWICAGCRQPFDMFTTNGNCPYCSARFAVAGCPECGKLTPLSHWFPTPPPPPLPHN